MSALQKGLAVAFERMAGSDAELLRILVNSRSVVEADLAVLALRRSLPDSELVFLCNLRELLAELPVVPFSAPYELDTLRRVCGWESTGYSYRVRVDSAQGSTGIEFFGDGNRVDGIVLHTMAGRVGLDKAAEEFVDPLAAEVLLGNDRLVGALVDALTTLGLSVMPRFYVSVADYMVENASATAAEYAALF